LSTFASTVPNTDREVPRLGKETVDDVIEPTSTEAQAMCDERLVAAATRMLEAVEELGWDQPARLSLIASPGSLPGDPKEWTTPSVDGLMVRWPALLGGHPCPSIAALGSQPAAEGALIIAEGWADRTSAARLAERHPGCGEWLGTDGRLEYRMAIAMLRDGTRVQVSRARGADTVDVTSEVSGRVPDALGMTLGIDPEPAGIEVPDVLRRIWLTFAVCHTARSLLERGIDPTDPEINSDVVKELVADVRFSKLPDATTRMPSGRFARLLARSVSGDDDATWVKLSKRLRVETSDDVPLIGWAYTSGVDPAVPDRWDTVAERNARRWAGPGMLAQIVDDAVGPWEAFDAAFAQVRPRTRTYLEALPDIDDLVADLAGNRR
jgi:hypothetical protein